MVKIKSNAKKVIADLDAMAQRAALEAAVTYERILQDEFRSPKTGRIYGAETEVSFKGQGGGEKDISFGVALKNGQHGPPKLVSFTARKGQKASSRTVKFIANKGKKWREGKRNSGMHRASAPGEAAAIWSGALRKGIKRRVEKLGPGRYRATVGVSTQSGRGGPAKGSSRSIAHMLEFGTDDMKARPSFHLALAKFRAGYRVKTTARKKK
jgi:hypothetical protein